MLLRLQRIFFRIAVTQHIYCFCLDLDCLAFSHRYYQLSHHLQRSACRKPAQQRLIKRPQCCYNLYVLIGAAIIQGNKLVITKSAHPSHYRYQLPFLARLQQILDLDPLIEHSTIIFRRYFPRPGGKDTD